MEALVWLQEFVIYSPLAIPLLIGILQWIKKTRPITTRFIPIIWVVLWIWISILIKWALEMDINIYLQILIGMMFWLSATWLYESGKNLILNKTV